MMRFFVYLFPSLQLWRGVAWLLNGEVFLVDLLPSLQSQWPSAAGYSTLSLGCSGSTLHCNDTVVPLFFFYNRWQRHLCLELLESRLQPNLT